VILILSAIILFILAGIAEIGGGYLVWLWLREGKPFYWGIGGGLALAICGVIATFQSFPTFGGCTQPMEVSSLYCLCFGDGALIRKHRIFTIGSEQGFV